MIRLTGPKWDPDEEVVTTALHDKQKFKVEELLGYVVGDDDMEQPQVSIDVSGLVSDSELGKLYFEVE